VLAVEPSETMIAQRAPGSAPAIRASAECIPLADQSFDAAMAVNTLQHWTDVRAGLRELRRIVRKRIVIFLRQGTLGTPFWLFEYFPRIDRSPRIDAIVSTIEEELPSLTTRPVCFPCDCSDGVCTAYWGRPEMYLDETIRRNISNFAMEDAEEVERGLERLRRDLQSGEWDRRHGRLRTMSELDLGHRILISELR
jgi:SAM-dependent methyltransferase